MGLVYLEGLLVNSDKKLVNTLGSSAIVSLYQGFNLMNQTLQMQRWLHSRRYYWIFISISSSSKIIPLIIVSEGIISICYFVSYAFHNKTGTMWTNDIWNCTSRNRFLLKIVNKILNITYSIKFVPYYYLNTVAQSSVL